MTQIDLQTSFGVIELPEKAFFKIGEVAKLLEVEPYVLRYWETEFDELDPEKTKSGQRVYQREDIELLVQIKALLYEEMFTIAGARRQLERNRQGKSCFFTLQVESTGHVEGTAVADSAELREELRAARQQLAAAETSLHERDQERERAVQQVAQLQRELAAERQKRETETNRPQADHQLVADLQEEIAQLQEALVQARSAVEEERVSMRRVSAERDGRRRNVLGALRREVEALAALAEPGRNRA